MDLPGFLLVTAFVRKESSGHLLGAELVLVVLSRCHILFLKNSECLVLYRIVSSILETAILHI